ncbi:MAG: gluconate 2-dehydrogenase subunit 3 family protein, partial [Gemmatimonadaceae bacterium]
MSAHKSTEPKPDAPHMANPRDVSRRDFVVSLTAIGAVWMTAASCAREAAKTIDTTAGMASAPPPMATTTPPQKLLHFSAAQAADVDAIASRIIPTDDEPGAHEAGALYFIDNTLTTFAKEQAPFFDKGLRDLAKTVKAKHGATTTFASLTPADQDAQLKLIEKTPFFGAMRYATIAGFLAHPRYGGNKDYIGWKFIGQSTAMEQ